MARMEQDSGGVEEATEGCESVAVESSRQRRWSRWDSIDSAKSCASNDVICPIQEEGSNPRASGRVGSFQTDRKVPAGEPILRERRVD